MHAMAADRQTDRWDRAAPGGCTPVFVIAERMIVALEGCQVSVQIPAQNSPKSSPKIAQLARSSEFTITAYAVNIKKLSTAVKKM